MKPFYSVFLMGIAMIFLHSPSLLAQDSIKTIGKALAADSTNDAKQPKSLGQNERTESAPVETKGTEGTLKQAVAAKGTSAKDTELTEEKEAMAVGGLVTVDAASDPADFSGAHAEVGTVVLSANVNVAEDIVASITLLSEGDLSKISIDQALVQVAPDKKPYTFIFGQQTFNFGLLSTRLISDPVIIDDVETKKPGITANFFLGNFTPGLAVTFFHQDEETVKTYSLNLADTTIIVRDSVVAGEANRFAGIINLDFKFLEESVVRLATRFYGDIFELNLGAGLKLGPDLVYLELYGEIIDDDTAKAGGYYAGFAYDFSEMIEAAVRYDGYSRDSFRDIIHRIGIGATFRFKHGIFCAFEYGFNDATSSNVKQEIALQIGLESTIKLPGFQRKTLTRK
jgi:hypothetical protein